MHIHIYIYIHIPGPLASPTAEVPRVGKAPPYHTHRGHTHTAQRERECSDSDQLGEHCQAHELSRRHPHELEEKRLRHPEAERVLKGGLPPSRP